MGSPLVQLNLTFMNSKRHCQGHPNLEALYLINETRYDMCYY